MRYATSFLLLALLAAPTVSGADDTPPLAKGVRGLVVHASEPVEIDGNLREWYRAFCTPVHYNHSNPMNRATQIFYLWDEQALYIGVRALDQKRANVGTPGSLWNGDAVEFYLDTRQGDSLRGKDWTRGAIHLFFTPFEGSELRPRWEMRGGIATSDTRLEGVQIAATAADWGYEVEFKIPWSNFPDFPATASSLLAIDVELCSGDGSGRTDRTFAYGSPLSVQQPASQGLLELVKSFEPEYLAAVGPATFPMWVDTPWIQKERAHIVATVAVPPAFAEDFVRAVEVRLHDADGQIVKTLPARLEPFGPKGKGFLRAVADWSIDEFAPNSYFASAAVLAPTGKAMAKVTPRMVQEAQMSGR
jgi:hypothetical protein